MVKGLFVTVLRPVDFPDCTNGGLSSRFPRAILLWTKNECQRIYHAPEDSPKVFEPNESSCVFRVVERMGMLSAQPADPETGDVLPGHWMFGGNFLTTSDSRFPSDYPIPIHDRKE